MRNIKMRRNWTKVERVRHQKMRGKTNESILIFDCCFYNQSDYQSSAEWNVTFFCLALNSFNEYVLSLPFSEVEADWVHEISVLVPSGCC